MKMSWLVIVSCFLISCGIGGDGGSGSSDLSTGDFLFQTQNIDIDKIAAADYKTVVIDYSSDGTDACKFTASDIQKIKNSGKTTLCYISIGEAEEYRFYWKSSWTTSPPAWLGAENPDWKGNYEVKYWDPEWQAIVKEYLKKIYDQGFDGIYLDIVDGYWYWSKEAKEAPEADRLEIQDTADKMIDFVKEIETYTHSLNSLFKIYPQNGTSIIDDCSEGKADIYFSCIDGIGSEDAFFYGENDMDNPYNPQGYVIDNLDIFAEKGKTVLCIEYLSSTNTEAIEKFKTLCSDHGFMYYAGDRPLDTMR